MKNEMNTATYTFDDRIVCASIWTVRSFGRLRLKTEPVSGSSLGSSS